MSTISDDNLNSVLISIDTELSVLKVSIPNTDFSIETNRKEFIDKIVEIKKHYNQIELILSNENISVVMLPALNRYTSKPINTKQMCDWITKIQKNLIKLSLNPNLNDLKDQYVLLDMIIKVVNSDAYFVGCLHNVVKS